ncbi:MAG: SMC family ATPase, partial [Nitrosopumilus sp.]
MRILSLRIQNFKPFADVRLPEEGDLPEGVFVIEGPNSTGKSSLTQAILWSILGEDIIGASNRKRLVKRGEPGCRVDLKFEVGGIIYRIVRRLTLKKSRTDKPDEFGCEADLTQEIDGKFVMTKDGCSQVNEEMEKLLGISYKNIANTVYIRQKEVDSLATADATELRKLITKLFGLDEFDSFKDKLTDRASSLQDEIDPLREKVGGLYSQREELNLKISIMASKQKELDTMTQEINNSRSMLEKLPKEEVVIQIEEIQKKVEQHDANLKELKIKLENLNRRIEEAQKRRTSSQVMIKQLVEDE